MLWRDSFPLSLHNIVYTGARKYGKKPGEWFGPATVSCTIRDLIVANSEKIGVTAYTADNGLIDVRAIMKLFREKQMKTRSKESSSSSSKGSQFFNLDDLKEPERKETKESISLDEVEWTPLIILVPIKAGMETVHPMYIPSLEALFAIPQNIGVVGGKPYSSFYFIAGQGEVLHFLDPHYIQDYVLIPPDKVSFEISTWTSPEIRWIKATNVDATFSAGFFIRNKEDFVKFETISKFIFTKVKPLFSFEHGLVSKESLLSCSSSSLSSLSSSAPGAGTRNPQLHESTNTAKRTVALETKTKSTGGFYKKEEARQMAPAKPAKSLPLPKGSSYKSSSSAHTTTGSSVQGNSGCTIEIVDDDDNDDADDFEIIV